MLLRTFLSLKSLLSSRIRRALLIKLIVAMSLGLIIMAFIVALNVYKVGLIKDYGQSLKYIFSLNC
jgi:hypothetical protein